MSTYIDQLMQIFNGSVWDGDLISKHERDQLLVDGLIDRVCGYNIITHEGVMIALVSGCAGDRLVPEEKILLIAKIAVRRFGNQGDGLFNSAAFSGVVSCIFGLPVLDGRVVNLILSGRNEIQHLSGGAHWKLLVGEE